MAGYPRQTAQTGARTLEGSQPSKAFLKIKTMLG